jgi:hypothetical protein
MFGWSFSRLIGAIILHCLLVLWEVALSLFGLTFSLLSLSIVNRLVLFNFFGGSFILLRRFIRLPSSGSSLRLRHWLRLSCRFGSFRLFFVFLGCTFTFWRHWPLLKIDKNLIIMCKLFNEHIHSLLPLKFYWLQLPWYSKKLFQIEANYRLWLFLR